MIHYHPFLPHSRIVMCMDIWHNEDRLRCEACSTIIHSLPPSRIVICMNIWNNGTSSLVMALVLWHCDWGSDQSRAYYMGVQGCLLCVRKFHRPLSASLTLKDPGTSRANASETITGTCVEWLYKGNSTWKCGRDCLRHGVPPIGVFFETPPCSPSAEEYSEVASHCW